ncbi:MAG TPA: hypothetical protein VGG97_29050 [Bryobacteraceae bacterium]
MVVAEERFPVAPAAAAHNDWMIGGRDIFDYEIGTVFQELAVDAKGRFQSAFDLRGCVVLRLQAANRGVN